MTKAREKKVNLNTAIEHLREIIWSREEGSLLGSEDDLTEMLNVSRPTVRQVARLLEQEGLLKVKRGLNGGYFSSRPSVEVIEHTVGAYLKMLDVETEDVTEIASVMWVMVVKKAARRVNSDIKSAMAELRLKVEALEDTATFDDVLAIEEESRRRIFQLINSPYIELIFHINRSFTKDNFPHRPSILDGSPTHFEFFQSWRRVKLLELDAISDGDVATAELAARRNRDIYHKRLWGHGP